MHLVDGLSVNWISTISGEGLCGGVSFMIKILIKSLSNVSYLFISFTGDEIIDFIQSWCHRFLLFLKFEMNFFRARHL